MVRYNAKESVLGQCRKFKFFKDSIPFTFKDFIDVFNSEKNSQDFLELFTATLQKANKDFTAYLWECPPVTSRTLNNQQFEFVVSRELQLARIQQNYSSFKEHFMRNKGQVVCSFTNLGRDATLVVPIPIPGHDYKNISSFTKNASLETQCQLWTRVACELSLSLKNGSPKWVSTNGLGVHYLHIRIDDHPKYYSFRDYTKWPYIDYDDLCPEHQAGHRKKQRCDDSETTSIKKQNNLDQYQPQTTGKSKQPSKLLLQPFGQKDTPMNKDNSPMNDQSKKDNGPVNDQIEIQGPTNDQSDNPTTDQSESWHFPLD